MYAAPRPNQPLAASSNVKTENLERMPVSEWVRQVVFSIDTLFFLVFMVYLVVLYLNVYAAGILRMARRSRDPSCQHGH